MPTYPLDAFAPLSNPQPRFAIGDRVIKTRHLRSAVPLGTAFTIITIHPFPGGLSGVGITTFAYGGGNGGVWEDELELTTAGTAVPHSTYARTGMFEATLRAGRIIPIHVEGHDYTTGELAFDEDGEPFIRVAENGWT